jgi:hypothetical protein
LYLEAVSSTPSNKGKREREKQRKRERERERDFLTISPFLQEKRLNFYDFLGKLSDHKSG